MGFLKERVKLNRLVFGTDLIDYYRNNTKFMYEKYSESDEDCKAISKEDIQVGGFYHLHYLDDSNWMRWSPIFCCDYRKFSNMIIILGVNFNFIPLELRDSIFDKSGRDSRDCYFNKELLKKILSDLAQSAPKNKIPSYEELVQPYRGMLGKLYKRIG
jgi:hypothetical protein